MNSAWTPQEMALLESMRQAVAAHATDATIVIGATEAGEPWCTIFSPRTGEIVVSFTKIAGDYIRMPGSYGAVRLDDLGAGVESFLLLWHTRR